MSYVPSASHAHAHGFFVSILRVFSTTNNLVTNIDNQPSDREDMPLENVKESTNMHEEHQYLKLVQDILEHGEHRPDRYSGHLRYRVFIADLSHAIGLAQARSHYLLLLLSAFL